MDTEEAGLVLACSVRHRHSAPWHARVEGTDHIRLPAIEGLRLELILESPGWSATGAELAESDGSAVVAVRWWFSAGHTASYALLVYGSSGPIDEDRFIDVDSASAATKDFDFGRWQFRSQWRAEP